MGYKTTDSCLQKAFDDERLFVLMTRDITSPKVVCEWIKQNIDIQPKEKLMEALECAIEMSRRFREMNDRKETIKIKPTTFFDESEPESEHKV